MLSIHAEEILRRQRQTEQPLLVARHDAGVEVLIGGTSIGAPTPDALMAYVDAAEELRLAGFLRNLQSGTFELTTPGRKMADALGEEAETEGRVPDTCRLKIGDKACTVEYEGVHLHFPNAWIDMPHEFPIDGGFIIGHGRYHGGHDGWFNVTHGDKQQMLHVVRSIPNVACFEGREKVTAQELHLLLKRPGLKLVRQHLLGQVDLKQPNNLLGIQEQEAAEQALLPEALTEYVDAVDDPRAQILADCEQDVAAALIAARESRLPGGVTAARIASSTTKRRFYNVRGHIRATLEDLRGKGLIQTPDSIHYEVVVSRLADIRKVLAGLPSDQLFDEKPLTQRAAYVPASTNEYDAFLCHASEDKGHAVRPFAELMQHHGMKPWLDDGEVAWGDNLAKKIQDGLARSRFVVVFLSNDFLRKNRWTEAELNTALSMEVGGKSFVLPVLLGITHEHLQARYPLVSAKVHREIPDYDSARPVPADRLLSLVQELKRLIGKD